MAINNHERMPAERRSEAVDVLRGYAALIVMLGHITFKIMSAFPSMWHTLYWWPVRLLWSAHQAVILFFVLSGFALTRMVQGMNAFNYWRYVAARIARLYPPYILSIPFVLVLCAALSAAGFHWNAGWMLTIDPKITPSILVDHIAMIGVFDAMKVNVVVWSLVHEMRISLVFPAIYLIVKRFGWRSVIGFVLVSLGYATLYWRAENVWPSNASQNLLATAHYATFFAAGCYVSINRRRIVDRVRCLSPGTRLAVWSISLAMFAYAFDDAPLARRVIEDLVVGLASVSMLALSFTLRPNRLFPFGRWLGGISYSLYLTHYAVVSACVVVFYREYGIAVTVLAAIAFSFLIAMIAHRLVEVPSIRLGRFIARGAIRGTLLPNKIT
jgi:peptidoglycan/LPS O-acetylase OafA/YrhL